MVKKSIALVLVMISLVAAGATFAAGDQNQGTTGSGSTNTGSTSQGAGTQTRTGR